MIRCTHRGEVWHEMVSNLCGWRGTKQPVYRCELHILCTYRPVRSDQRERVCLRCSDAQEPEKETV
jgi:hypothetical protein